MLTAVFAGSMIAGPGQSIPAVREALTLLEVDSEIINHAMPWRLTRQQLPLVDEVTRAAPDLVVVAHGGCDGMMVRRPPGAGHITRMPDETPFTAWRRETVHRGRLGNRRPAVPFRSYERHYRRLVGAILDRTDALVTQIGPSGADERQTAEYREGRRALLRDVEAGSRGRVVSVWPSEVLASGDFRPDRTHLLPSGMTKIAEQLAARLAGLLQLETARPLTP